MTKIAKAIRIEPAFHDREHVRSLFARHAPYAAAARYLPDGAPTGDRPPQPELSARPWFRGNWALGGEPLVDGVEPILHNPRFLEAARASFGTTSVVPTTVVVNVNPPMPAGVPHVDVPSFHGATREHYPLLFLLAMGASGLFEEWRVVEAGAIAWFYEGAGGHFDYWPEGLDGPMRTEQPPFGNVAIIADNDRMYHRIGRVGGPEVSLPRMTAAAVAKVGSDGGWVIVEGGEIRAEYPANLVRLSVLWKAEVLPHDGRGESADALNLDRVMETFIRDLRRRALEFSVPSDPWTDQAWITLLRQTYEQNSRAVE